MVNTEIRLIIFFAAKDGKVLYNQKKQGWELTVAQIMDSLLPNSKLKKAVKTRKICSMTIVHVLEQREGALNCDEMSYGRK